MNESIINNIKEEITSREEKIRNLETLKDELEKLKEALSVLESKDLKTRKNDSNLKLEKEPPMVRPYTNRKELDKKILEEAINLASQKITLNVSTGEIRNNLLPMSDIHGGMNNLRLYNRIYFVLSKRPDLFHKSGNGWLLKKNIN